MLRGAGPPCPALPWAVVVHGLNQGALTLHNSPCVCEDTHLENQVDPAIPAVINRRAEGGARSSVVGRRRHEKDVVLPQLKRTWSPIRADTCIIHADTSGYTQIHT